MLTNEIHNELEHAEHKKSHSFTCYCLIVSKACLTNIFCFSTNVFCPVTYLMSYSEDALQNACRSSCKVRFEDLMVVTLKITVLRYVAPCSLIAVPTFQSTLKMVVSRLAKTSVNIYYTIWRQPEVHLHLNSPLLSDDNLDLLTVASSGGHR
jgi:hypothetical protein